MPRLPKDKSASPKDSSATIGFEAPGLRRDVSSQGEAGLWSLTEAKGNFRQDDVHRQPTGGRQTAIGSPPKSARRGSADTPPEGSPQVASAARDNDAKFAKVQHFIHLLALQSKI